MITYSNIFQSDSCLSELHQKKLIVRSNTPHKHGCLLSIYFDNYTDTNFRMEKENLLFINNLLKRSNFRRLSTFTTTNRLYSDHKYSYLFLFTVILPLILSFCITELCKNKNPVPLFHKKSCPVPPTLRLLIF